MLTKRSGIAASSSIITARRGKFTDSAF